MEINIKDLQIDKFFDDVNNNQGLQESYKKYVDLNSKINNKTSKRNGSNILAFYLDTHENDYILENIKNVLVESITVSPKTTRMKIGEEKTFTFTVLPENATNKEVTITSSGAVSVSGNKIIPKTEGNGEVLIVSNENNQIKDVIKVTVEPKDINVSSVKITNSIDISQMNIGDSVSLKTEILPVDSTNKKLTWKSSNTSVAKVDENGLVTAISDGASIISAESSNGIKAIANAKVLPKKIEVESVEIIEQNVEIGQDDIKQLNVKLLPENATNKKVTWESSHEDIAKVDENGQVTGISGGQTIITAKSENNINGTTSLTVHVDMGGES